MLDMHSHILPKMDDGSKSVEMSLQMLRSSKKQGVTTIISTSHFYGHNEHPERFLERREHSFKKLSSQLSDREPEILLGAEVYYYPGISNSDCIAQLAIEGTDLIMIEMPFIPWSDMIFDELISLQYRYHLQVVLAHVERYQSIQKRAIYERLFEQPFYFQCNASVFSSFRSRRLALKLLDRGLLHFLGTDCHNTDTRPPNMQEAQKIVEKKLSPAAWRKFTRECEERFNEHRI